MKNNFERRSLVDERLESERLLLIPIAMKYSAEMFKEFSSEITTYMHPAPAKNISEMECLYYLHDSNREIHCAKTYEEHKINIDKYL